MLKYGIQRTHGFRDKIREVKVPSKPRPGDYNYQGKLRHRKQIAALRGRLIKMHRMRWGKRRNPVTNPIMW